MAQKKRAGSGNELDLLATDLAEAIDSAAEELPTADVPFGAEKLTRSEQQERYAAMRDDPQKWLSLLEEHGLTATVDYWLAMEGRRAMKENSDADSQ